MCAAHHRRLTLGLGQHAKTLAVTIDRVWLGQIQPFQGKMLTDEPIRGLALTFLYRDRHDLGIKTRFEVNVLQGRSNSGLFFDRCQMIGGRAQTSVTRSYRSPEWYGIHSWMIKLVIQAPTCINIAVEIGPTHKKFILTGVK